MGGGSRSQGASPPPTVTKQEGTETDMIKRRCLSTRYYHMCIIGRISVVNF